MTICWHIKEAYAYCIDFLDQLKNFFNGTYCLYFSEGFYVDRFTEIETGIPKVSIWIGPNFRQPWKRVFISNQPNAKNASNLFLMTIPDLQIKGKINTQFITPEILNSIRTWIRNNQKVIEAYSERISDMSTSEFLNSIKPL